MSFANAEENQKFISLDACKAYFAKSVTPAPNLNADTYCKNRVMSFVEACTETKIAQYVVAQKLKAFTDLSDSEQRSKKSSFNYQCQISYQDELAANDRKAASAKAAQAAAKGNASSGGGSTSAQKAAETGAVLTAVTPLVTSLANDIEKAQKAAAASAQSGSAASTASASASTTAAPAATASAPASTAATPAATASAPAPTAAPAAESAATAPTPSEVAGLDPKAAEVAVNPTEAAQAANAAKGQMPSAASETTTEMPQTKSAVDQLADTTQKVNEGTAPPKPTAISELAKTTSQAMQSKIDGIVNTAQNQSMGIDVRYVKTASAFSDFRAESFQYTSSNKVTCASLAENASFLCVEGTSPGTIAAKKVMEASGPILAVANSAIKACSSTAKVTRLVGLGLTVAKGVCVASKLACDASCSLAVKDLGKMQASIQPKIGGAIDADFSQNASDCSAKYPTQPYQATQLADCHKENARVKAAMITQAKALVAPLQTENNAATKGTSPAIVLGCQGHTKDILLFALQAGGAYAAHKNAKACEEKLASSGAAANAVTTQQYCEKTENLSTQLCLCQKNPMATGCPGAIVTDASAASNNSEKGINIKGVGGSSSFAGGFGSAPKPKFGNPSLGKENVNNALGAAVTAPESSAAGLDSAGSGAGGGSGAGSLGGAPTSSSEVPVKKGQAEEKKKWSFGSFGGDDGLSIGGSGSGGSKNKSGSLTANDQAAIQRQIATEKFAAEVSTASGKSNWEKVRNMYLMKENSFIFGQ